MSSPRGGWPSRSTERSQTAVLGIVLLIGMVATLSLSFFLVAGETITGVEHQSEEERVEGAVVELSQQLQTASSNGDISRSIDLEVGQDGAVVREETGVINVTSDALADDAIEDLTIGTVEYESDDGTTIAYEAGAVFREKGNETQVVSEPSIHYDTTTKTLTLPVVTAIGERELGSGDVTFAHNTTKTFQEANVVEDESVTITIQSDYYRGWESFFRNQAGDAAVRDVDHENRTIEVEVGYIELESAYETGVTYSDDIDDFGGDFDGETREGNMPEMDPVIDELVDNATSDPDADDLDVVSDSKTLSEGTYYADAVELDETVTWQLDGNATLVVDGDFEMQSGDAEWIVDPSDDDYALRVYVTGDFDFDNGEMKPDPSAVDAAADQLQVYGTSDMDVLFQGGTFHGTMYAASDDWEPENELAPGSCNDYQVCFISNPEFDGGLVAHSVKSQAAAVDFEYDDTLEEGDFDAYPDAYNLPPQLTYLNVAHHEVDVTSR